MMSRLRSAPLAFMTQIPAWSLASSGLSAKTIRRSSGENFPHRPGPRSRIRGWPSRRSRTISRDRVHMSVEASKRIFVPSCDQSGFPHQT